MCARTRDSKRIAILAYLLSLHSGALGLLSGSSNVLTAQRYPTVTHRHHHCGRLPYSSIKKLATEQQEDSQQSEGIGDGSRREFLSWGSAAVTSASALGLEGTIAKPSSAVAAATTSNQNRRQNRDTISTNPESYDYQAIPFSSVRRYKTIVLPQNKLRVLLVHDATARQASAALTIADAGQFADPIDLPGMAHLMEHMILSYCNDISEETSSSSSSTRTRSPLLPKSMPLLSRRDFEDWLSTDEVEGASNAFTAYDKVCFHFSCRTEAFGEALQRFAELFWPQKVQQVCRNMSILQREIRRVDSELDFSLVPTQAFYLLKKFVNEVHPFARFAAGNLETLEVQPKAAGIDVGTRLFNFFQSYYLAQKAVLVIVGPQDLLSLERKAAPFAKAFSNVASLTAARPKAAVIDQKTYPGGFLRGTRPKQLVLFRRRSDEYEKLTFNFALDLDYRERGQFGRSDVTATQICFVLSQIFGRRGPGSLYAFLLRRGWAPLLANSMPRFSIPLEVSGFQICRLEIPLTVDGFVNRSVVVDAVYNILNTIRSEMILSRSLLMQFATVAKINGYLLAARPPDSIELAVDAQFFGVTALASGEWYRFQDDKNGINLLQKELLRVLADMADIENAVIIATAGSKALLASGLDGPKLSPRPSPSWMSEPISGGRFCFDDMLNLASRMEIFLLKKVVNDDEIQLPVLNPLIPSVLRPARKGAAQLAGSGIAQSDTNWIDLDGNSFKSSLLPLGPPESTGRCVFVLELLSPRPARASIRHAARAELWKISFDRAVSDIAELGSFSGLAYDLSFNKFGLRIAFLGLHQTLPSYARRICRRLAHHHDTLLNGNEFLAIDLIRRATNDVKILRGVSVLRRNRFISSVRSATAYEAAAEGASFLRSCTGAVCFSQGDLLPIERLQLLNDIQQIFTVTIDADGLVNTSKIPSVQELLDMPQWKPRAASSCGIPGAILVNDACGRIPR